MSNEEIVNLIKNGIDIEWNYTELCENNKGIVYKIASKYSSFADIDDLIQEGYIGLMAAVEHYEPGDVKFISYATYWIKQYIYRYANNDNQLSAGDATNAKIKKFRQVYDTFYNCFGKKPTMEHIAYCMGVSIEDAQKLELYAYRCNTSSIDISPTDDTDSTIADLIPGNENVEDQVVDREYKEQVYSELWKKVDSLTPEQAQVIRERYKGNKTIEEVGKSMGITKSQARNIGDKAIRKLAIKCRHGIIREYADEYIYNSALKSRNFHTTWTSSTEYTAFRVMGVW